MIIGLAVVFFGIALLLRNVDPELGRAVWRWWPVLLILVGLRVLFQPAEYRQNLTGGIITLLGFLLLLNNLDVIALRWGYIWPIVIVLVGLAIVFRSLGKGRQALSRDFVNLTIVFGGGEFRYDSPNFRGGKVTAIMGGGTIDLRGAKPAADEIVIDAMTIMGGLEIRVPVGWQVVLEGTPILGGMENKTASGAREPGAPSPDSRRLIVRGMTIMGGLEVKN
jgi:predicted membrane protein